MDNVVLCLVFLIVWTSSYTVNPSSTDEDVDNAEKEKNTTQLLNRLLQGVDPRVRPNVNGPPVTVKCGFYIISFGSVSEIDMEYTMDIYMRQEWRDPRMKFTERLNPVVLPAKVMGDMWTPDIFFPNEKSASFHEVTVPNKLIRVYPNGTVIYSVRITMTLSCPMILTHFPMDTQTCVFKIESYGHELNDMVLEWQPGGAIEVNDELQLPQFNLIEVSTEKCTKQYSTGQFPCLKVLFVLERQFGFYLLQTYIPSILIVILSWVSFWINLDAVPARISLGVTTVLTMATQLSGSRASIPKVSYPKAIDVWMSMCMMFVFAALLEYAFVNVLARNDPDKNAKYKKTDADADKDRNASSDQPTTSDEETGKVSIKARLANLFRAPKLKCPRRQAAFTLDKAARYFFPAVFLLFNIVYWSVYTYPRSD